MPSMEEYRHRYGLPAKPTLGEADRAPLGPFPPVNLDGLSAGELEDAAGVLWALAEYAKFKGMAVGLREGGLIEAALVVERKCEEIYAALPAWARW